MFYCPYKKHLTSQGSNATSWHDMGNTLSEARWEEYKSIFKHLKLENGMRSWGKNGVLFISSSGGLMTGGAAKGYIYRPDDPTPLFDSLDGDPKDFPPNTKVYRQAENKDWYLFYEWDD